MLPRPLILLPIIFVLGIVTGIYLSSTLDENSDDLIKSSNTLLSKNVGPDFSGTEPAQSENTDYIQQLEADSSELHRQVAELESVIETYQEKEALLNAAKITEGLPKKPPVNHLVNVEILQEAGIDEATALQIMQSRNAIDLALLELTDKATREGFMKTSRYLREMAAIKEDQIPLRDSLGDTAYDLYLYNTGQTNRLKILSVMLDSSAALVGIKNDDLILNYNQSKIFNLQELKNLTSQGNRDEYVSLDVVRNDEVVQLWIPRGPLGVRIGTEWVEP